MNQDTLVLIIVAVCVAVVVWRIVRRARGRRGGCFRAGRRRPLVLIGEPEAVLLDMEGDLR